MPFSVNIAIDVDFFCQLLKHSKVWRQENKTSKIVKNDLHDQPYSVIQTKEMHPSAQQMDKLFSSSFSSSSLVARNTVSLSVRRHSTAAALAQSATPETQENR